MAKLVRTFHSVLVDRVLHPPRIIIDPRFGFPAVVDGHPSWLTNGRSRPRYFDGRFLAARDLERDQTYFTARQADHFRAAGIGVIHGLQVSVKDQSTLSITPGAAITPDGSLVVIRNRPTETDHERPLDLPLFDAPQTERLDREFGLLTAPREVPRRRTGVFVLLARPVEYSANPIGMYPASIEKRRAPEDGDIIEATALTLAPFHDLAADVDPVRQRAALARRIFVERADAGMPVDAVPLALVRLERGFVVWVDPWLVRREIGPAHGGIGRFTRVPRAVAEAHVQQYHAQLAAIAEARTRDGRPLGFSAGEELAALPSAGALPAAALDLAAQSERFFPQAVPVTLQVVPDDEIATVLDEQLAMPPIDLTAPDEDLAAIPVALLVPVPRTTAETLPAELRSFPLRSSAPAPGRRRARTAVSAIVLAERFATTPLTDDRGSRLAGVIGTVTNAYYARLRRARAPFTDGVATIDRQLIG